MTRFYKSHIRKNQINTTNGLHYYTTSFDLHYYSNYSRQVLSCLFWVVWSSTGGFRPSEGSGLGRISTGGWPDYVGQIFFVDFAAYQPLRSQHIQPCNLVSGLQSWSASSLKSISATKKPAQPVSGF